MNSKKYVLVVDDYLVDRMILERILSDEYTVLQAENGCEALAVLEQKHDVIAGIILDLVMPVMDGYAFLEKIAANSEYANIPVIVSTGDMGNEHEAQALELGAWDFVAKPYDATILKFRLKNAIARSQLSAFEQLKYLTEFDTLTDIYSKSKFFSETRKMIDANPQDSFAFVRFDVDRFQLVNLFFGSDGGDHLLRFIADGLRQTFSACDTCTYGRIESDVFSFCLSYQVKEEVYQVISYLSGLYKSFNESFDVATAYGLYFIDDNTLPITTMSDRATLAGKAAKGNYADPIAEYLPEMSKQLEQEQELLNDLGPALANHQFVPYFQPKYDLTTNEIIGSEALIRWVHPEKGLVSPALFIPTCEKNGLIAQVDHYIWDAVCAQLRTWIDKGINPGPVSVNMSQVNLYNSRIVEDICDIADTYSIDHRLLQIEVTESAYMDNPTIVEHVVDGLHERGFTIHMDDFGNAYSSLSLLKDINVDVLKVDMRFLGESKQKGRGECILASVLRMAKWLGIPSVTEGVETQQQADFLRSVGCEYAQGFLFARPMPAEEYEALLLHEAHATIDEGSTEHIFDIQNGNKQVEASFAQNTGPLCVVELGDNYMDIIRANELFCSLFDVNQQALSTGYLNTMSKEVRAVISSNLRKAIDKEEPLIASFAHKRIGKMVTLRISKLGNAGSIWIFSCEVVDCTPLESEKE